VGSEQLECTGNGWIRHVRGNQACAARKEFEEPKPPTPRRRPASVRTTAGWPHTSEKGGYSL
jgi:hypothetical protein